MVQKCWNSCGTNNWIFDPIISEKVKLYKKNLENNVIESSKDLKRKS